ncbi:conserved Plasmodium protein, unknown function [Plasmodium yoelii]|uniref:Uncharacterized protein n=2 Tax=Plasmodium yoelii TaxID=5861 RepID=A0AAE9WW22_PLAYO|nr:conserved Plasmodium protein, unknown function [Plasmodium yoelii]WBY57503.1 hypothetical protein Py17XNL_000900380 [Plasmodium yoelii yoelii]CDU18136.1 conserved Plasmodium protein, unknown function [Plasmodium yoelii]VTZ78553.1 conserved Plasmodium protein, unknown function [Plasmodium yoelii]|eukprot:XP_724291.2 conserved Plasmodium protein, unknown function [Plasmodium yoelii]
MSIFKFNIPIKNTFLLSKSTICSLKLSHIYNKKNNFVKYGQLKYDCNDNLAVTRDNEALKYLNFLNNNFFLSNLNKSEQNYVVKQKYQDILRFKNKKTKLALRRKRKRMGERVSLRYR